MNGNPNSPHEDKYSNKKLYEKICVLERVIFGDERTGQMGMNQKVNEMYEVMRGVKSGRKGVLWFGSLLAALGTIIYFIKGGIK